MGAPVVLAIDYISALCHKHFPHTYVAQPAVVNHLGVRATIDIDYEGIFLLRVEVQRLDESVVVLVQAVGRWDCAEFHLAGGVFPERVAAFHEGLAQLAIIAEYLAPARIVEAAEGVEPPVREHGYAVPALFAGKSLRLAETYALVGAGLVEMHTFVGAAGEGQLDAE